MILKFLTIAGLLIFVNAQTAQRKVGDCPPVFGVRVCNWNCYADFECDGPFKCCMTACGGTLCTRPVRSFARIQNQEKTGNCPETPTGPWVCSSRCSNDSDCRGTKKCCKNRCGAMACTRPEY